MEQDTGANSSFQKETDSGEKASSVLENEQSADERTVTGIRWFLFVVSTLTAIFVYSLDNTIVANIVPVIVNDFDAVDELAWLSVGFMIGGMAVILPVGRIYTIYDSKWVFIVSTVIFLAASALCGGAPSMNAEIVGRVFAGAGGNGMYFGLLALLSMHTTTKERPQYLSYTGLVWGLGTVLGPVVGGGFSLFNWRWGFYINLLFGAILLPTYLFVIPSKDPMPDKTQIQKLAMFDWAGIILSIGAMVTIIIAINLGGVSFSWGSGSEIALFVVTGILWILLAVQQVFCIFTDEQKRIFPVHLLKQKMPVLLFIACASAGTISYVAVYYIPIYFQFTRGDSAIYTAVRLLPYIFMLITFIPLSGALMSRWGWFKPWYIIGSLASLITAALMSWYVDRKTPAGIFYVIELFLGAGVGAFTQSSFAVVQSVVSPADGPHGLALMLVAQLTGMTLGLSIGGAVFVNTAADTLVKALPDVPREQLLNLVAGASNDLINTLSPEMQIRVLDIIVSSWQNIFICIFAAGVTSFISGIFMTNGRANMVAAGGG